MDMQLERVISEESNLVSVILPVWRHAFQCWSWVLFFFFLHRYRSIVALQCGVSFCCITKWISCMYTFIPIFPPSCASFPPSLSHPLGGHKAPSWSPCAMWLLPTSYLFYIWECIYVHAILSLRPSFPFPPPHSILKSILYVCVFIPVLPLGSSEPFFF